MRVVGVSHIPRITWLNRSAVSESTMITAAFGPIAEHSSRTARFSPVPVRLKARPLAVGRDEPAAVLVVPTPKGGTAAGPTRAITQHTATMAAASGLAPSRRPRSLIQAAIQVAARIRPGSTLWNKGGLGHGWEGVGG